MALTSAVSYVRNLMFLSTYFLIANASVNFLQADLAADFAAPVKLTMASFQFFYPEWEMSPTAAHYVARVVALRGFIAESEKRQDNV